MPDPDLTTKFASPTRSDPKGLRAAYDVILNEDFFVAALNAYPDVVMVLNENRQIVYSNQKLVTMLGIKGVTDVLGKRPGEVVNCIHAETEEAGCGTSMFCRECGAVRSILSAQKGQSDFQECRMTVRTPDGHASLDLRVWAVPVKFQEHTFTFFTIKDIADEKRREALERTFFHDVLNEAGILAGYSENMKDGLVPKEHNPAEQVYTYSQRIIEFIQDQRDLISAERGLYNIHAETFPVGPFLNELVAFYQQHRLARERKIILDCRQGTAFITTDKILLRRVLGNLIKNALEATSTGNNVTVWFWEEEGQKVFSVHNTEVMPASTQLQLFQRSFTTKGIGRGVGTYSVKLFTEQYLKGKVSFESKEGSGTTFFVRLL